MVTYLLIVATTFFAHSSGTDPTVITFQEFKTQVRCEQMAKWINQTYGGQTGSTKTHTHCVVKE